MIVKYRSSDDANWHWIDNVTEFNIIEMIEVSDDNRDLDGLSFKSVYKLWGDDSIFVGSSNNPALESLMRCVAIIGGNRSRSFFVGVHAQIYLLTEDGKTFDRVEYDSDLRNTYEDAMARLLS